MGPWKWYCYLILVANTQAHHNMHLTCADDEVCTC